MKIVRDLARTDELVIGIITERLADPEAARKLAKPTVDTKALHDQIDTLRKLITATREEYERGADQCAGPQRPHRADHREAVPAGGQAAGQPHVPRRERPRREARRPLSGSRRCRWTASAA